MYFCLYLNIFRITFFLLYHRRAIVQKPEHPDSASPPLPSYLSLNSNF